MIKFALREGVGALNAASDLNNVPTVGPRSANLGAAISTELGPTFMGATNSSTLGLCGTPMGQRSTCTHALPVSFVEVLYRVAYAEQAMQRDEDPRGARLVPQHTHIANVAVLARPLEEGGGDLVHGFESVAPKSADLVVQGLEPIHALMRFLEHMGAVCSKISLGL